MFLNQLQKRKAYNYMLFLRTSTFLPWYIFAFSLYSQFSLNFSLLKDGNLLLKHVKQKVPSSMMINKEMNTTVYWNTMMQVAWKQLSIFKIKFHWGLQRNKRNLHFLSLYTSLILQSSGHSSNPTAVNDNPGTQRNFCRGIFSCFFLFEH